MKKILVLLSVLATTSAFAQTNSEKAVALVKVLHAIDSDTVSVVDSLSKENQILVRITNEEAARTCGVTVNFYKNSAVNISALTCAE